MNRDLVVQLARAMRRPDRSIAHVRCIMDNMGDRLLAAVIARLLARLVLVDYTPSRRLALARRAARLAGRPPLFAGTCLGGGTLIFGDIDRGWGTALQDALARTSFAFSLGTGVIDPDFRDRLHHDHGLKPLPPASVERWLALLERFDLVTVRGNDSLRLLRERGIGNVEVVGDPALLEARERAIPKTHQRRIGINLANRSYFFCNANARVADLFTDLVRRLRAARWTVTLYPMGPEDVAVTDAVLGALADPAVAVRSWRRPLAGLFDDIGSQDIFIGVRLHAVAAAVCTYTPAIMIAYQPKNIEFMQTLGFEEHCVRIDAARPGDLIDLIEHVYGSTAAIQARQAAACADFKQRLLACRDRIEALAGLAPGES